MRSAGVPALAGCPTLALPPEGGTPAPGIPPLDGCGRKKFLFAGADSLLAAVVDARIRKLFPSKDLRRRLTFGGGISCPSAKQFQAA